MNIMSAASLTKPLVTTSSLDYYGRDLTALARANKLEPLVGREDELKQLIQILIRRVKPNPVLVGEAGVGKTALVEGLAQLLAEPDTAQLTKLGPALARLKATRLVELPVAALVAGASMMGQFEERLRRLVAELEAAQGEIIVFIDEVHTLLGAGGHAGTGDAANLLKPALARGLFPMIGATTPAEYQRYIARDAALERRFTPLYLAEPNTDTTTVIVQKLLPRLRQHYQVNIGWSQAAAAVRLADHFLPDRRFPDKAIELLDLAASIALVEPDTAPDQLILNCDQVAVGLKLNVETTATPLLLAVDNLASGLPKRHNGFDLKATPVTLWLSQLVCSPDTKQLLIEKWPYSKTPSNAPTLNPRAREVSQEHLQRAAATLAGVRPALVTSAPQTLALHFEQRLDTCLPVLQPVAPQLAELLARRFCGPERWRQGARAVLLLTGATTQELRLLGQGIAGVVFGEELETDTARYNQNDGLQGNGLAGPLLSFDMTHYREEHSSSGLIGAPPGYIGYDEGGRLVDAIMAQPGAVLMLHNIEQAHPQIQALLAEAIASGKLRDARGRSCSLRQLVIVLTSAKTCQQGINFGFGEWHKGSDEQAAAPTPALAKILEAHTVSKVGLSSDFSSLIDLALAIPGLTR